MSLQFGQNFNVLQLNNPKAIVKTMSALVDKDLELVVLTTENIKSSLIDAGLTVKSAQNIVTYQVNHADNSAVKILTQKDAADFSAHYAAFKEVSENVADKYAREVGTSKGMSLDIQG